MALEKSFGKPLTRHGKLVDADLRRQTKGSKIGGKIGTKWD